MANPKTSPSLYNYVGVAFVLAFFGMMLIAMVYNASEGLGAMRYGGFVYAMGAIATAFGFMTKEDNVAIGGIIGLNLAVVLDIGLNIGVLTSY